MTVFFFAALTIAIMAGSSLSLVSELRTYRTLADSKAALAAADAATEDALYRIAQNMTLPTGAAFGLSGAGATTTSIAISSEEWEIYGVGGKDQRFRRVYLTARRGAYGNFHYGAQAGAGGLTMDNGAIVRSTLTPGGANVYSNGPVYGKINSDIEGDIIVASGVASDMSASSTVCVADENVGKLNAVEDFAQGFVLAGVGTLTLPKISVYLKRNGNPQPLDVSIAADSGGVPGAIITTESVPFADVATSYGWVDVLFPAPASLTAGTQYWIVLDAQNSASKYWVWCRSGADVYVGGSAKNSPDAGAGTWNAGTGDLTFKTFVGEGWSTLKEMDVTGDAKADIIEGSDIIGDAYYQSITGSSVGGTSFAGSPTPPLLPMPLSTTTIEIMKQDGADGGTIVGDCGSGGVAACNAFPLSLGPKKIDGDLELEIGEVLTLTGTLYVTGDVEVSNNSLVECAPAFGDRSCAIVADGNIEVKNNGDFNGSGDPKSFVLLLSTISGCDGSTLGDPCTSVGGGIRIANNATDALFYASDSTIHIKNNAIVTAIVAKMIDMETNTTIDYDPNIMALEFAPDSSTSAGGWRIRRWAEY
jgi:hypothetical protein